MFAKQNKEHTEKTLTETIEVQGAEVAATAKESKAASAV